jgi:hypothetical protein
MTPVAAGRSLATSGGEAEAVRDFMILSGTKQ